MLIDWFTVCAQIVNFLVLVWLLHRYLYQPILAAVDTRENGIRARTDAAAALQAGALQAQEAVERQRHLLDAQQTEIMETARQAAMIERNRILEQAGRDADQRQATQLQQTSDEITGYREEFLEFARTEIVKTARKIVLDLASTDLEQAMLRHFLVRLKNTPTLLVPAGAASMPSPASMLLRTTFPLSETDRLHAEHCLQEQIGTLSTLTCETLKASGVGLELILNDQKFSWTLDEYLAEFESHLTQWYRQRHDTLHTAQ